VDHVHPEAAAVMAQPFPDVEAKEPAELADAIK